MSIKPVDCGEAVTLENRVIFLFKTNQTQSDEFNTYLRIFGRDKILQIWNKYKNPPKQIEREPGDDG